MPRVASSPLPATVTTAQLAHALGLSERGIASRRMDGRLPVAPDGHVDFRALIRAGLDALARRPGPAASDPAGDFGAEMRAAADLAARLVLAHVRGAGPGADLGAAAAAGLREAFDLLGLAEPGAPVPARLSPLTVAA